MKNISQYPKLLRALIKHCNDLMEGLIIVDAQTEDLPLIDINDEFTRITGYILNDVFGKNPRFLQGPETDRRSLDKMGQCLNDKLIGTFSVLNYRKDGSPFWNRFSIMPINDESGKTKYWACIIRDITPLIESIKEKSEVNAMVSVIHTMSDLVFNYMNYLQLFRLTIEENAQVDNAILKEFDDNYAAFLNGVRQLSKLENFREIDIGDDIKILDMDPK